MRISFDLDDTLILSDKEAKYESPERSLLSRFYKEKLRMGIVKLYNELTSLGFEICVYTTSERSVGYVKRLFSIYGLKPCLIVNLKVHQEIVQGKRKEIMPSKVPSRFGIDLHVDDDNSVKQNGRQYGFNVVIVKKDDESWYEKVLDEAIRIKKLKECDKV